MDPADLGGLIDANNPPNPPMLTGRQRFMQRSKPRHKLRDRGKGFGLAARPWASYALDMASRRQNKRSG